MTDTNKLIISLIENNYSMKDICNKLDITQKQFYIRLKQIIKNGYILNPNYMYSSDVYYDFLEKKKTKSNEVRINIDEAKDEFRCLVISDAHIGNIDSDFKLLNEVYNYAAKNGINIILSCGDMMEGVHSSDRKSIRDVNEQIETFIKKYPYDKDIINFGILGNHEYHFLHYDKIDVLKQIKNSRYDIVLLGYGDGLIRIRNESILLHHYLRFIGNKTIEEVISDAKFVLSGHGHMMKTRVYNNLVLCVPTISRVSTNKNVDIFPSFIDLKISLSKDKFDILEAKQMIIAPKVYQVSETRCNFKGLIMSKYNEFKRGKN